MLQFTDEYKIGGELCMLTQVCEAINAHKKW